MTRRARSTFTHYFLTDGIRTTPAWQAPVNDPRDFAALREGISGLFDSFLGYSDPNEAVTEQEFIRSVLELLGWTAFLPPEVFGWQRGHTRPPAVRRAPPPKAGLFLVPAAVGMTRGRIVHILHHAGYGNALTKYG